MKRKRKEKRKEKKNGIRKEKWNKKITLINGNNLK